MTVAAGALTVVAALLLGAGSAAAATFSNPSPITIPFGSSPATPYPSQVSVSGLTGTVSDVNVGLRGFSNDFSPDVHVALVSPGGRSLLLLAAAGNGAVSNLELTIDDQAAGYAPAISALASGSYKPTNNQGSPAPNFPSPGPGTSYGNPGPALAGTASFGSVFNGDAPNGSWNLYVYDFATGMGAFAGGWSLELGVTPPAKSAKKKCKKKKKRGAGSAKKKKRCKKKKKK